MPSAICDSCRLSTTAPHLLRPAIRALRFGRDKRVLICPRCSDQKQFNFGFGIFLVELTGALFLLYVWLSGSLQGRAYGHPDQTINLPIAILLFEPITIILHELAHAFAANLVGFHVLGIRLGSGRLLFRFFLRRRFFEVHLFPLSGTCVYLPPLGAYSRWKAFLVTAAGPILHIIILSLIVLLPKNIAFERQNISTALLALFYVNCWLLIANLLPRTLRKNGKNVPSDGKKLLTMRAPKKPRTHYTPELYSTIINDCLETGQIQNARSWLEKARSTSQNSLNFRLMELLVNGAEGNWAAVEAKAREWMPAGPTSLERDSIASWLAVAMVYQNLNLDEADGLCREVSSTIPWDPSVQTLHALVCVAQKRLDDAEALLERAGKARLSWICRAAAAHIRVEIYRLKRDIKRERKWQLRAKSIDPTDALRLAV